MDVYTSALIGLMRKSALVGLAYNTKGDSEIQNRQRGIDCAMKILQRGKYEKRSYVGAVEYALSIIPTAIMDAQDSAFKSGLEESLTIIEREYAHSIS